MSAQWNHTSAQRLREFLASCPEFLLELAVSSPRSGSANTLEMAACAGQRNEGFMLAVDRIKQLAESDNEKRSSPFLNPKD